MNKLISPLLALSLCAGLTLSAGCASRTGQTSPAESTILAMDTVMQLTVYGSGAQQALDAAAAAIYDLEDKLSATDQNSDIWAVNHAGGSWTQVSSETARLLSETLAMCRETDGALDPTAYPAVQAWGFTSQEELEPRDRIPSAEELAALAALIDYTKVELDENQVRLPQGMALDLGATAKGYTGDCLARLMEEQGIDSAIFSLGGNVQAVGSRPDGSPWRVGIQDPAGSGYLGVLEASDCAVVTSGNYERFFQLDGITYCHIMDPKTASPVQNELASVTIVGPSGLRCDALSTALFVMGTEQGAGYWREHQDFQAIWIEQDGSILLTAGLEDAFSLSQGYENREVTVLQ